MAEHRLKTWPEFFAAVKSGVKTFDVRREDAGREFRVGDTLILEEWVPELGAYTGARLAVRVTYVLRGGPFLPEGLVAMAVV